MSDMKANVNNAPGAEKTFRIFNCLPESDRNWTEQHKDLNEVNL